MSHPNRDPGFTLVELLVAMAAAGVVAAAVHRVLMDNQRFYRAQSQIIAVQQNTRAVALVLAGELRELDAAGGDIIAMARDSITIKAMRGLMVVCAAPDVAAARVVVRNAPAFGYRAVDAARDSVLLYREGDPGRGADDSWLHAPIGGLGGAACSDGAAGTRLALTGLAADQLGPNGASGDRGVLPGAPVRTFEVVTYRLYEDETGAWWLGARGHSGGAWGAISPVAGPLCAAEGLGLEYRDAGGSVTATPTSVAGVLITVRGRSPRPLNVPGRRAGYFQDSAITYVALRNNER